MEIKFDIISIITSIGISLVFFFIIIIMRNKKGNFRANIVFSFLLIAITLSISNSGLFIYTNIYYYIPHIIKVPILCLPFFGPLLYIYVMILTHHKKSFVLKTIAHFIPGILYFIINIPFFFQSGDRKIAYINALMNGTLPKTVIIFEYIGFILIVIQAFVYMLYILRYLNRYETDLRKFFSSDKMSFSWIKRFIILLIFIFSVSFAFFIFMIIFNISFKSIYRPLPIVVVVSLCNLAWHAAKQSDINIGIDLSDISISTDVIVPVQQSDILLIAEKLVSLMNNEKVFKDMDVSLSDLAERIGVTRNQLSYVINTHFKENFCDFINRYRVEEVKRILDQPDGNKFNVLNVGMDAGFSSKTAFNVNFKQLTGMSPTEYKKSVIKSQAS
jgi:AraC-like DNA-binding protein